MVVMVEKSILESIETEFRVDLDSVHDAEIVYNSIKPEISYEGNERSVSKIRLDDKSIVINIFSKDIVSLRASMNSYIRWINLSLEILNINKG